MPFCDCCPAPPKGEVFRPRNTRWCTDVSCLLLLLAAVGLLSAIAGLAISAHPDLLYSLIYPTDSYGNYCGRPGTATSDMPKVFYPDLDADIVTYGAYLASQQYLTFLEKVTRVCATDCPQGVSLSAASLYGGASYPIAASYTGEATQVPEYTYTFATQNVVNRCFPLSSSFAGRTLELCVTPHCTDAALNATFGGTLECRALDDRPEETTTWELCPVGASAELCALRRASCAYVVQQASLFVYTADEASTASAAATATLADKVQLIVGVWDGVLEAYPEVLGLGVGLPLGLGFGWCALLWFFAGVIVYLALLLLVALQVVLSLWLCFKSGWFSEVDELSAFLDDVGSGAVDTGDAAVDALALSFFNSSLLAQASADEAAWYQVAAVLALVATVVTVLLIWFWRKCIKRCIAIVRECTKVFRALPALMAWPLQALLFQLGFVLLGLLLVMWTLDDQVWSELEEEHGIAVEYEAQVGLMLYCIFVCAWLVNWCKAISWSSMASAVGYWFVHDNAPGAEHRCCKTGTGAGRLYDATWTIVSKHLGSMAVGSFVIALCQLIRIVLRMVDRATKTQQGSNLLLKLAIKCSHCAMWCLQKTIEFVSYYGYIFVAIEGCGFCKACQRTFELVAAFPAQAAVNGTVKRLLGLLMGWSSPVICSVACFYTLDANERYRAQGYTPLYAAAFVFVVAFTIADAITTVFDCAIDTIYLSAFKDMKENDPPKFMSDDLRTGFGIDRAEQEAPNRKAYEAVSTSAKAVTPADARLSDPVPAQMPPRADSKSYVIGSGGKMTFDFADPV